MATVVGTYRTKSLTPTPDNIYDGSLSRGNVLVAYDEYTFAASDIGTVVQVCPTLPSEARIVDILINNAALGSSVTLSIGDSDTATRYISAYGANSNTSTSLSVAAGRMYKVGTNDGDNIITITTAGAAATGKVQITVLYAMI